MATEVLKTGFSTMKPFQGKIIRAPSHWSRSCTNTECTLHQLSPFIGKLKSAIARELIITYSRPGDLIVDPFAGSGTIPLEALLAGRRALSADVSLYAKVLCKAKLEAPASYELAMIKAENALGKSLEVREPDLRKVPFWVRQFFNSKTLKDAVKFSEYCKKHGENFLLACFLGILHHQRPGFLSYPSSHLVPYLRNNKYPPMQYPHLYEYRELRPRLLAKIRRAYTRKPVDVENGGSFHRHCSIERLKIPESIDCLITSPPYMNALDYCRDNRLRLWFVRPDLIVDWNETTKKRDAFINAMTSLAKKVNVSLKRKGYCVIIIGEQVSRSPKTAPSYLAYEIISTYAPQMRLLSILEDKIPDIRRSRRDCKGTKIEHFLIFNKK